MVSRIDYMNLVWVDLQSPSAEDIVKLTKEFGLSPVVSEELLKPTFRPRAENYGSHLFLVLHFPLFDPPSRRYRARELDFVIGQKYFLTIHYEPLEPLAEGYNAVDLNLGLRERIFEGSSEKILYFVWRRLYENLLAELDFIQKKIDKIEERVFTSKERDLIQDISILRRDLLDFFKAIRPQATVLDSLESVGKKFFGETFETYLAELSSRHRRLVMLLENYKDSLETIYDTNDSLLTHRSNEIIKTLTMMALLTFPLTLIAAIFSINAEALPIVGRENDFWIILSIMAATILAMLTFFKYRRWI